MTKNKTIFQTEILQTQNRFQEKVLKNKFQQAKLFDYFF